MMGHAQLGNAGSVVSVGRAGRAAGRLHEAITSQGRRNTLLTIVLFDQVAWCIALIAAAIARLEFDVSAVEWTGVFGAIAFGTIALLAIGMPVGLYWRRHQVGTHGEFRALAVTMTIVGLGTSFVYAPILQAMGVTVSRSLGLLGAPLAVLMMASARSWWRTVEDHRRQPADGQAARLLVFGAGSAGLQIIRALQSDPEATYVPVAILDDDPSIRGRRLAGLSVYGSADDMAAAAQVFSAETIPLATPTADAPRVRELVTSAESAGLEVRVLPPINEILDGRVDAGDIRELRVTDLLQREQSVLDVDAICGYVQGRRVLVTGAGGSIGSELSRQLTRFAPASLHLLDRDESALLALQLSIDGKGQMSGDDLVLADIRDRQRVHAIFEAVRPEVVFHAAALKHVPLLENHPTEGLETNVIGTLNVLEAAQCIGVSQFVNISTDKAADPENVLGYTKRIAERLTAAVDLRSDGDFKSVRFGNVLGSRGSVLTTFEEQVRNGGPVTVTDPEVTRYFMTIEEAVRLVIQAGAVGTNGEVLVLDMGEPVRIVDLAKQVIAAADRPIEIVYTGLRPGERLHEQLFAPDEIGVQRSHPQIWNTDVEPLEAGRRQLRPNGDDGETTAFLAELAGRKLTLPTAS